MVIEVRTKRAAKRVASEFVGASIKPLRDAEGLYGYKVSVPRLTSREFYREVYPELPQYVQLEINE
jgi:hypothetical protein